MNWSVLLQDGSLDSDGMWWVEVGEWIICTLLNLIGTSAPFC